MQTIRVGDIVTRMIGGVRPMSLKVTAIDDEFIHCGPWKFDRTTGGEVDEDLGWTAQQTGSYLKEMRA